MAEDIGIELHDKIKRAFDARCGKDSTLTHIKRKIENGTATMEDTSIYARRLGELLRKSVESTTKPDDLPGEKMYYNIAQSILEPLLRDNYEDVNGICAEVQRALDAKKGIGIAPQKADFPAERIRAAIGGAAVKETAEHAIQVLGRTAENITGSFQTDYIKKNAEFRGKAGLTCYIERKDGHNCCKWCAGLAGRYRYPDEVPRDVYRRHDNCTCDVSYVSEKGRRNVHTQQLNWSKEKNLEYLKQLDAEKKAKRAEYKANGKNLQKVRFKPSDSAARRERIERAESLPKPMKLTRAEAKAKESEILAQRRLTYDAKRGIIKTKEVGYLKQAKKRDHKVFITDTAISKVDKVVPSDFTDEQAEKMQQMHKKLLSISKNENNSNEVLIITGCDFSSEVIVKGGEFNVAPASNPFAVSVVAHSDRQSLVYLHNHPSTNTFSVGDIDTFCCERAVKMLTVVTNQGEVYIINKTGKYSFSDTRKILTDIRDSFPDGEIDDKAFVEKYLKECHKGGVEYVKAK